MILPIHHAPAPCYTPPVGPLSQNEKIRKIAIQTLTELAVCFSMGLIVSFYAPVGITYVLLNPLIHCAGMFFLRFFQMSRPEKNWMPAVRGTFFAQKIGSDFLTFTHEAGHALGTCLVYQNPRPSIQIFPLKGGYTSFFVEPLTSFGRRLGAKYAVAWVTLAGPLYTLTISAILLWVGLKLIPTKKELAAYLMCYSFTDFMNHSYYALSTLWTPVENSGHDFVRLSLILGLPPIPMAIAILAIPIFIFYRTWPREVFETPLPSRSGPPVFLPSHT